MPRRRSRFLENRRNRKGRDDGPDPQALIRLTGLGAMLLLFVAVGAGFQGERVTTILAGLGARLGPLAAPVLFGLSVLEIAGLALVLGVAAAALWRGVRR